MRELRERLNVPVGESGVDMAIRAGRYADIAQGYVDDKYGDQVSAWGVELTNGDRWVSSLQFELNHKLDNALAGQYEVVEKVNGGNDSWGATMTVQGRIKPKVDRVAGGSYKDYTLRADRVQVVTRHPFDDASYNSFLFQGHTATEQAVKDLEGVEHHFSLMPEGSLPSWQPDLLTDRTMHPIELDEMGMLEVELLGDRPTISIDSAVRLLNGIRHYFRINEELHDYMFVPTQGEDESAKGWEGKPHGKAFRFAMEAAGVSLEPAVRQVEGKREVDRSSFAYKYWIMAHHIVMRNTVEVPIIGGNSTSFSDGDENRISQPKHYENRYAYDATSFRTLVNSSLDAAEHDSGYSDEVAVAVRSFFEHLDANNRIDLKSLLQNSIFGVGIGAMLGVTGVFEKEDKIAEYEDMVGRLQAKIEAVGVEKADSGITVINM